MGFTLPGLPAGALGLPAGDPAALMRRLGSAVFGMQVGQAAGTLSREVFGATDVGLPLLDRPATVLLPTNVAAFAEGLDAPAEEVRLFLALREAAHARLFTHVSWLRGHLRGLVDAYARGITIDLSALESQLADVDLADTDALQRALSGGVFGLQSTPEQQTTLARLETTLALVEGWVDEVTAVAALPHLPHAVPLREMLRRRRAAGGPAEHTFATLVGLELRPRRSRDAAALWALIAAQSGAGARDAVWDHPDLLPDGTDLDDPSGYEGGAPRPARRRRTSTARSRRSSAPRRVRRTPDRRARAPTRVAPRLPTRRRTARPQTDRRTTVGRTTRPARAGRRADLVPGSARRLRGRCRGPRGAVPRLDVRVVRLEVRVPRERHALQEPRARSVRG